MTEFSKVIGRKEVLALSFGAMFGWSWVLLSGDWLLRAGTGGTAIAFIIGGVAGAAIVIVVVWMLFCRSRKGSTPKPSYPTGA